MRAIHRPMPRLSAGSTASGIEITRISTNTVATAPSPSTTRLSGIDDGRSKPYARSATSTTMASPMKNTSLPSVPVCQPITASFTPSPEPEYQPMKLESMSTSPATQVTRSPAAQMPSAAGR